jgi:Rrf2 family protein
MFSKTCEYAIRALIFIAHKSKGGHKTGIKEISAGIDSPAHFIAKILQDLSRRGLVQSMKGPTGGFYLDETCLDFSLADVVRAVDGNRIFNGCGLGLKECSETHPCPLHHEFLKLRNDMQAMLEKTKLKDFTTPDQMSIFLRR